MGGRISVLIDAFLWRVASVVSAGRKVSHFALRMAQFSTVTSVRKGLCSSPWGSMGTDREPVKSEGVWDRSQHNSAVLPSSGHIRPGVCTKYGLQQRPLMRCRSGPSPVQFLIRRTGVVPSGGPIPGTSARSLSLSSGICTSASTWASCAAIGSAPSSRRLVQSPRAAVVRSAEFWASAP